MTVEQITLFSLLGVVFALLLWGRFRYDLVAFAALIAGVIIGVIPQASALFWLWPSGSDHHRSCSDCL